MAQIAQDLAEEEQTLLPIVSATLTQSEWDALGKHGMSVTPLTRRLVMTGPITEETDDAEQQKFMQVVPTPARLAYKLIPGGSTRCGSCRTTSRDEVPNAGRK